MSKIYIPLPRKEDIDLYDVDGFFIGIKDYSYGFNNLITLDELRLLSKEQISILKENADKGDVLSQCKLSLCILFRQVRQESKSSILHYLNFSILEI